MLICQAAAFMKQHTIHSFNLTFLYQAENNLTSAKVSNPNQPSNPGPNQHSAQNGKFEYFVYCAHLQRTPGWEIHNSKVCVFKSKTDSIFACN
jgi:hypothetical protein